MGYLREKYGDPEDAFADSKWIKFTKSGQVYAGTIVDFEEGMYGTDVVFSDDKRVTLNNTVLQREVVKLDPEKGDRLTITYLGEEPKKPGSTRNPAKLYRVEIERKGEAGKPAPATAPIDESDAPF